MPTIAQITLSAAATTFFVASSANAATRMCPQSPQHTVVPQSYASTDAVSYNWLAGASRDVRQQTLVGASYLTAMIGRDLTALELRRTAADETYTGGTTSLTVTLSIAPHGTLQCSSAFAANIGQTPVQVFSGTVTLPTSPPVTGNAVAWTPDNVVRIPFTTPFAYPGGTLCIDIVGTPIAGQEAEWWMADAEFEDLAGTITDLGGGGGAYGGPQGKWSHVSTRSLLPGNYAHFFAYGPPLSVAFAAFGTSNPQGIPLTALGFNSPPGCALHLATIDGIIPAVLIPDPHPALQAAGGRADIELKLPGNTSALGMTMTTQWLEWSQLATSNAIEWQVAASVPTLDMALIEGDPSEPTGSVSVHSAHVLRFEHQ